MPSAGPPSTSTRQNPLAHYELMKALVAKGDCAARPSGEAASFKALPVKPEAKQQADAILATCGRSSACTRVGQRA